MSDPRRVIYIIVDGMNRDALEQTIASGRAPALRFLKENSSYVRDAVAIFPTITPAATASLVTGATPARHGIPGMCWYDRDAQRFVNYGQSPRAAVIEGVSQVVNDFLVNLNARHLSGDVATIHEKLDRLGLTTASINFMIFRGPYHHELQPSLLEKMLFFRKTRRRSIPGPREHYFADIVTGPTEACTNLLSARGLEKRLRATDAWASCVTRELVDRKAADMILFYLHENDHHSHRKGPSGQVDSLADADRHIAHVLDAFDPWERALEEVGFVVTADHSQSPVADAKEHIINFDDVLDDFKLLRPRRGKEHFGRNDLAWAGNGRVVFFYINERRQVKIQRALLETLAAVEGVDQVLWRDEDGYVVDGDRGRLRFRRASDTEGVIDERGNRWRYEGDLEVIGGVVEGGEIVTPEYPLAMWRIEGAMDCSRIGEVVATMSLTFEATDIAGGDHRGGGDHASLHAQDSIVPFMSTIKAPPVRPSTVDVCPHIVGHFERLQR
ncbi:MAG TPA: alkaline phosphatase family protein [Actinomycetota bacterium]|nr:alkaline phosphatase family protein [Actinomycetota bacterium]